MISRRRFLATTASASAFGAGAIVAAASVEAAPHDPLLEALTKYRADLDFFNRSPLHQTDEEDDALQAATWGPFWNGVIDGDIVLPPPTTMAGAVMALRCALEEKNLDVFEEKLILAVLPFLEGEAV